MREEDGDDSLPAEQSILRALVFNYGDGSLFETLSVHSSIYTFSLILKL